MLHIRTLDLADDTDERSEAIRQLLSLMETWAGHLEESGWEEGQKTAWLSNYRGLTTFASTQPRWAKNCHVVVVYETRTKIGYLLGGVRYIRGRSIELSEVISNPGVEIEKARLDDETNEFMDYLIHAARQRAALPEDEDRSRDIDIVNRTAQPLGCLFAWAAFQHPKVTLTANTLGLVYLYEKYGFEIDGPVPPHKARYLECKRGDRDWNEKKYAEINLPMKLKEGGEEDLLRQFPGLGSWIGTAL